MSNKPLLTRKQIANTIGVTPTSVRNYEKEGKIIVNCWVNGRPRYSADELNKLLSKDKASKK